MGSTRAILSRSFCNIDKIEDKAIVDQLFGYEMNRLKEFEKEIEAISEEALLENQKEVNHLVGQIVQKKRND